MKGLKNNICEQDVHIVSFWQTQNRQIKIDSSKPQKRADENDVIHCNSCWSHSVSQFCLSVSECFLLCLLREWLCIKFSIFFFFYWHINHHISSLNDMDISSFPGLKWEAGCKRQDRLVQFKSNLSLLIRWTVCLTHRGYAVWNRTPARWLPEDDGPALRLDPVLVLRLDGGLQAGGQRDSLCQQSGPLS